MIRLSGALVTAALAGVVPLVQQPPTFRAESRLVVLQATVRDHRGALITTLPQNAFTVYENGKRQPIALFRTDDVPVTMGVLLDNSGSMRSVRPQVARAAIAFVRASNPRDEVFVLDFADKAHIDVPMTSDLAAVERGLTGVDAIGGTAMYDALQTAQNYLAEHGTRDRKALIVITDGNDNASATSLPLVQSLLDRSETVVYAVGLFGNGSSQRGRHDLDRLTERSGGAAYYPASIDEIDRIVLEIADQIRKQYTIGYTPIDQRSDGSYRSIRVTASGPGGLTVRTRTGYYAGAHQGPFRTPSPQ